MKFIFSLLIAILCISALIGQGRYEYYYPAVDTVDDTETILFTWSERLFYDGTVQVHAVIDSLSGATAGTFNIDVAMDPDGTQWYTASTTAMNGVQTIVNWEDTTFTPTRIRCRAVGSGTMSAKIQPSIIFKRKY